MRKKSFGASSGVASACHDRNHAQHGYLEINKCATQMAHFTTSTEASSFHTATLYTDHRPQTSSIGRQAGRQAGKQADRQTDRQAVKTTDQRPDCSAVLRRKPWSHLCNNISTTLAFDDPVEQGVQAAKVGHR